MPSSSECPQVATIVADHYRKLGVNLKIEVHELAVFMQYIMGSDFDISVFYDYFYMEPDILLRAYHSEGKTADRHVSMTNDPEADALIESLWGIFDREERRQATLDVQRALLKKHGPLYPLCSPEAYLAHSSRLKGLDPRTGLLNHMGTEHWVEES